MVFHYYDDEKSMSLMKAAADVLDLSQKELMEIFGDYFYHYTSHHGYGKMLNTLGTDFMTFVSNLDFLHSLLKMTYKGLKPPSFVCERGPEGETRIHIYTVRRNMNIMAINALRTAAKNIFGVVLDIEILIQDNNVTDSELYVEHTFVQCTVAAGDDVCSVDKRRKRVKQSTLIFNKKEPNLLIPRLSLHTASPYSLIFDKDFQIQSVGVYFAFLCPPLYKKTAKIDNILQMVVDDKTNQRLDINYLLNSPNEDVILSYADQTTNEEANGESEQVFLKGRMIPLVDSESILFLGNPYFKSLKSFLNNDVFLKSIPLDAFSREVLFMDEQRRADVELSKKIDQTTAEVKKMAGALEEEKRKTDVLLHEMLPKNVATALKEGQHVEAEKFQSATILFTDIVTFTVICSNCEPIQVVDLLNDMFRGFDKLTTDHNLYKVETIGDAYMVVGGVPAVTSDHAERIVSQGMCMCTLAGKVKSPVNGQAIQIRCGIHTGPVVTGVVGTKMPRFCLFGDTVNTASRMESHGVAGRVHISPSTFRAIDKSGLYAITPRGEVDIKGKGTMYTYFVDGFAGVDPYGVYKTVCQSDINLLKGNKSKNFDFLKTKKNSISDNDRSQHRISIEGSTNDRKMSEEKNKWGRRISLQRVLNVITNRNSKSQILDTQINNSKRSSEIEHSSEFPRDFLSANKELPPLPSDETKCTTNSEIQNKQSNCSDDTKGNTCDITQDENVSSITFEMQTKSVTNCNSNIDEVTLQRESNTGTMDEQGMVGKNHLLPISETSPRTQVDSVLHKEVRDASSPKHRQVADDSQKTSDQVNNDMQNETIVNSSKDHTHEFTTFEKHNGKSGLSNSIDDRSNLHQKNGITGVSVLNSLDDHSNQLHKNNLANSGKNVKGPSTVCILI